MGTWPVLHRLGRVCSNQALQDQEEEQTEWCGLEWVVEVKLGLTEPRGWAPLSIVTTAWFPLDTTNPHG